MVNDQGKRINLQLDPPKAVQVEVFESVKRWRARNLERKFPQLYDGDRGRGPITALLWKLLKPNAVKGNWTTKQQGGLKSTWLGR